jgi:hypothetical protein
MYFSADSEFHATTLLGASVEELSESQFVIVSEIPGSSLEKSTLTK